MKKTLLIAGALLALTAGMASAAGINLSWNNCGSFGAANQANLCTSNSGSFILVASVTPGPGLNSVIGQEMVVDLQTSTASLNPWWTMKTGGCRPTSISVAFGFGILADCADSWGGQALGGYAYDYAPSAEGHLEANRARLRVVCAVSEANAVALADGTEYYLAEVLINKVKSAGLGQCAGCLDQACIVLNSVKLSQPDNATGGNPTYSNGIDNQAASYNGGSALCNATPTHNKTWGSVKALYR